MKKWLLLAGLVCVSWALVGAQGPRMSGFSVSFFDAAGRATRKLTGTEASQASLSSPMRVREALVTFFDANESGDAPSARLFLDEAIYAPKEQIATGVGELRYRSAEGNITGKGYRYEAAGDRFTIRDGFRMELPEGTIEGREVDVKLARVDGKPAIESFEGRGKIVFTPKNPEEFKLDRAESERAWYAASDGMLNLASPVHSIYQMEKGVTDFETLKYPLKLKR